MEARDAAFASMFALCCGHESMRRNRNAEAAAVRIDTSRLNLTPRGHEEKTPSRLPFSARHSLTEQASHKPDVDAWSPLKSDQSRFDFDAPARMPCGDTVPDFDVGDSNDVSEVPPADATQGDASYRAPLLADDTDGYTGSAAPLEKLNSWKQEAQERSRTERRHSTDQAIAQALEHIHKSNGEDMKPLLNGNAAQEVAVTAALGHLYQNASVNGKLAVVAAVAADAADARVPCVSSDLKMETKLAASAALKLAYSAASPRSSVGQMKTKLAVSAALKHAYSSASSPREALKNGRHTPRQISVSAALRHVYRYSSEDDKQRATDGKSAVSRALRYLYRYASDKAEAVQTRAGVVLAQGEPDGRLDRALQQIASARSQANFEKCEPVSSATSQPTCGQVDDPGGAYLSPHAIQLPDFTRMDRTSALVDYVWYPKAGPAGMDLLIVIIKYEYYTEDTLKAVDVLVEFMRQEIHSDFVSIFDISEMAIPSLFSMPWLLSLGRERQPEFTIFRQCQQSFAVIRGNSYLFNTLVDTLVVLSGAETAPTFATDQAEALTMLNKLS